MIEYISNFLLIIFSILGILYTVKSLIVLRKIEKEMDDECGRN